MRNYLLALFVIVLSSCLMGCGSKQGANPADSPDSVATKTASKVRRFQFHYRFAVSGLEPGKQIRAWLPVPPSNEYQTVKAGKHQLPGPPAFDIDNKYRNTILFVEATVPESGSVDFDVPYDCLLYTSPSPRDATLSRMPSCA